MSENTGNPILGIVILALCLLIYFIPSIVAFARNHLNSKAIFMLNLLAGWTLLGWVGALVWACTNNQVDSHGKDAYGRLVESKDQSHQIPHDNDSSERLERLFNLKQSGAITEEEYEIEKKKIIS